MRRVNIARPNAKADRGNRGREHGAGEADSTLRDRYGPEVGGKRGDRDGNCNYKARCRDQSAFPSHAIHQCSGGTARDHGCDAAEGQYDADAAWFPLLAGHQIDGEEWTDAAGYVGQQEVEPIEGDAAGRFHFMLHAARDVRRDCGGNARAKHHVWRSR